MRISKPSFCALLLHKPYHHQNLVVLSRRRVISCAVSMALLVTTLYVLWPSGPDLKIVGLKLRRIKVHPVPPITVDISMLLTLRVRNADVYFMDLGAVNVAVAYRGKMLGHVRSREVHVRARGSSHVEADVEFAGISVLPELVLLLEDVAKGLRVVTVELSKSEEGIDRTKGTVVASVTDSKMQGLSMSGWRTFWRKIKREKRRLFSASSPAVHAQYDPNSYSHNFDDGFSNDPDNLSRSFSARFAVPSKIFDKNQILCPADKL
ncbi:hypothetical protein ACSQ67_011174 [Phaseolus vulgaris]